MVDPNKIEIELILKDLLSKEFSKISKKLQKSSKKAEKSLGGIDKGAKKARKGILKLQKPTLILSSRFGSLRLAALSATGALIGVGAIAFQRTIVASIKRLEGFERQMNVVAAITRSTGVEFKSLENLALQLGGTTVFTASQASEAMTDLARSGKDAAEIFEILPKILDVAAAGQLSLANASKIVQNVLAVSNLEASKAGKVTDVLAATSSRSRTTIEGLGKSFQLLAGTQRDVGLTLEETSSLLAIIGERGIIGSRAGTSLASAFSSLVKPTVRAQKVLAELGITILDSSGNIKNFIDFMGELEDANVSVTQKAILFEKRGLRAVNAILTEGIGNLRKFGKGLNRIGGEAARLAKEFNVGLPGAVKKTESAFDKFQLIFAKIFEPAVIAGLNSITIALVDITDGLEGAVPAAVKMAETINFLTKLFIGFETELQFVIFGFRLLTGDVDNAIKVFNTFKDQLGESAARIALMDENLENLRFNLQRAKNFENFEVKIRPIQSQVFLQDAKSITGRLLNVFQVLLRDDPQVKFKSSKTIDKDAQEIVKDTIAAIDKVSRKGEFSIQLRNVRLEKVAVQLTEAPQLFPGGLEIPVPKISEKLPDFFDNLNNFIESATNKSEDFIDKLRGISDQFSRKLPTTIDKFRNILSDFVEDFDKIEFEFAVVLQKPPTEQLTFLSDATKRVTFLREELEALNKIAIAEKFKDPETLTSIMDTEIQIASLTTGIELLKKTLTELGFAGLVGAITAPAAPDKPEDEKEPFSPLTGFAAGLFGFTDATNTALEDFEERFGASAGAIELIATGMGDVLRDVSAAVVGGFIDQAIAGEFSAKALAASAFKALSSVLKAVAIEATIKGFLALAEGIGGGPLAPEKFASAAAFFKTAALAGVGAIAAGITGRALAPKEEERDRGVGGARRFGGGGITRVDQMPISEQQQRRQGEINITVLGFVGNEQELGAALGPIIRQATNDDIDFGVNVELA